MKKRKPSSHEPNREERKRKLDFKRKKDQLFEPGSKKPKKFNFDEDDL
jgi:hypothetical protein